MNSSLSGTILIADPRGRGEILKLLRGEPSVLRRAPGMIRRRLRTSADKPKVRAVLPPWLRSRWVRAAIAFLLPALAGAGFYAMIAAAR